MSAMVPFLITACIYSFAAFDYWRELHEKKQRESLHRILIALALAIHAWILHQSIFQSGFNLGLTNSLSAILWLTVFVYWLTNFKHKLSSLQAFVLPPAALVVLLQGFLPSNHSLPYAVDSLFLTHLLIAMLAYSLFTLATLHALLMAVAEKQLHQQPTLVKLPDFPPLLTMERLLFRVITLGFVLLTLTLLSGILFSEQLFQQPMKLNHKNIFALLSWLIYGALLFGHYVYGWRGRTAIRWTISGFFLLLLAYIGSKFVLEIILHR